MAFVAADRHASAEVGRGADLAEMVVAAELAIGVPGDPGEQELALDIGGPAGLGQERLCQASGADLDRRAEQPHDGRIDHS